MAEVKKGRQTPTQAVTLPYDHTHGAEAVELYNQTGRTAQQWQELLLYDILAENGDGLWVHTKFGYSVPRRNGKNEIAAMRELWGLQQGESILHTAHRTTTSHAAWERLCSLLDKVKIEYKAIRATGRENIRLTDGEGRIEFRTRSSKGGLGEGFDLLVIDEAQEYTNDQESALKYVVTDSRNPQTLFCGTPPTPVSSGTVFLKLRSAALQGQTENTGWAEWSVEHQSDPQDRALWYETNPSLGTIFTERSVADEIGSDPVDFNIQRLGLWLRYNQKSAISRAEWETLQCPALPKLTGKLYAGIKYGKDGDSVALSIAVKTAAGQVFVEAIDCQPVRAGNDWIISFLSQADIAAVAVDGANGQQLLAQAMKDARLKAPLLPTVKQVITANAAFEQGLYARTVCHMGQPSVVQAVSNCEKRAIGTGGGFGYRSVLEGAKIELLDSIILAYWQCAEGKERRKQKISY
ncbi:MAG: phage terminase family protein [Oscillospiraceae bacterium]|nr:phage terminase family protein [Oscillospiraceae bacterium]